MASDYIRYDEIDDVLASTDLLALVAPRLADQPALWKWAIIAAQNGLQGAFVCALHDAFGTSVLTEKSARAVLNWHENEIGEYPLERLADFETLLKRFCKKNPSYRRKLTRQQFHDMRRLHRHFRNSFEHFRPLSWSIEKVGLPRIVGAALAGIELLMQHESVVTRLTGNKTRRLKENLNNARKGLL